jgi:16S rRNA (guanine527-N7)-methyltransferase
VNLTAARRAEDLWRTHVADSLALAAWLPRGAYGGLDLGSGGGLPGMVLAAAAPASRWLLVDSVRKKVAALGRIGAAAGLDNVAARWGRAEELGRLPDLRERFEVVTVRAVAEVRVLLEYAGSFLRVGGSAWLYKSSAAAGAEVHAARAAARRCGLELAAMQPYRLSGETADRVLLHYRKVAATPGDLPRSSQQISRAPL